MMIPTDFVTKRSTGLSLAGSSSRMATVTMATRQQSEMRSDSLNSTKTAFVRHAIQSVQQSSPALSSTTTMAASSADGHTVSRAWNASGPTVIHAREGLPLPEVGKLWSTCGKGRGGGRLAANKRYALCGLSRHGFAARWGGTHAHLHGHEVNSLVLARRPAARTPESRPNGEVAEQQ